VFDVDGVEVSGEAVASGPVEAMTRVLMSKGVDVDVLSLTQHSQRPGSDSAAITLAECRVGDRTVWGMGSHQSVTASAIRAVYRAVSTC